MGWIGKIENWLMKRKEDKDGGRSAFEKRRSSLSVVNDFNCPQCHHHKAFMRGSIIKCTRCGYKGVL